MFEGGLGQGRGEGGAGEGEGEVVGLLRMEGWMDLVMMMFCEWWLDVFWDGREYGSGSCDAWALDLIGAIQMTGYITMECIVDTDTRSYPVPL